MPDIWQTKSNSTVAHIPAVFNITTRNLAVTWRAPFFSDLYGHNPVPIIHSERRPGIFFFSEVDIEKSCFWAFETRNIFTSHLNHSVLTSSGACNYRAAKSIAHRVIAHSLLFECLQERNCQQRCSVFWRPI
jgi:hypothetical protein